ncbi:MAG: hypothetical protein P8078_01685, partial [bacterium]
MNDELTDRIKKISMLLCDVDGVLTRGGIILGSGGQEFKQFDVQDGMGITLARQGGLKTIPQVWCEGNMTAWTGQVRRRTVQAE